MKARIQYILAGILGILVAAVPAVAPAAEPTRQAMDPELRETLRKAVSDTDSFADRFEGEVWLTDMSKRLEKKIPDHAFRIELLKNVHYESRRARLEPELVLSVIQVESNFNPYAISRVGAIGLMQIMPFWLKEIGKPGDSLFSPYTNLRFGCTILRHYLNKEKGNQTRALMRYNGTREYGYPMLVHKVFDSNWRIR
ncbi:MAG: transglycosylase SLT domain-containing protein [Gammaproteobacteria bacterium]|nr:transglycosylase SLT domain-containing protein [Gammaproteobacteria bacterium]